MPKNMGPLISYTRTLFGQFTQMRNLGIGIAIVLPALNLGFFADHLHEQYDGDNHANADCGNQVECDG